VYRVSPIYLDAYRPKVFPTYCDYYRRCPSMFNTANSNTIYQDRDCIS